MHFRIGHHKGWGLIAAGFFLFHLAMVGEAKSIRLRNELIDPQSGSNRAVLAAELHSQTAATGLFLLQFDGPLAPARRVELRAAGVELLQFVPDDAFIARLNRVPPAWIGRLSFVRWIGPYRSEHKIHPRLAAAAPVAAQTNGTVAVTLLLATTATPAEITTVRSHLAGGAQESHMRQGAIVRGELLPGHLASLAQSPAVLWLERTPRRKLGDEAAAKLVGGNDGHVATPTVTQQLGFTGAGVTVCVTDTGLDTGDPNTLHPDLRGRVAGFQYYGALTNGSDGYGHGTHCAGIVAGNAATGETDPVTGAWYGLGVASGADLFIERIFDANAIEVSPFPSDETMTRDAVRHGAKIGSNSWGNDVQGEYDLDAAQFDELVRDADADTAGDQPLVLEFSAGNAGPNAQTMDSPASAKNVLTTGASENVTGTLAATYGSYANGPDTMCAFSSRGPCMDGRLKPDLVAPGSWIASAASSAAPDEAANVWATIDDFYVYWGGTSMSGAQAAGAAAVFMQYYESLNTNAVPSPALVKAALINSAGELNEANGGPGPIPNNDEGWGRITLTNVIVANPLTAPRYYEYLDQTVLLTNSQVYAQHVFVQGADQRLKITLAYTDVPGFPGAQTALVNDLDLEVVGPDGTLYRGNQFAAGESVPNAPTPDTLNNVEGVTLAQPAPGDYLVRVRASSIVQDAVSNTPAIDQDFALVASGDLTRPGTGLILLDRTAYTAPGVMQLEVLDAARAASNRVSVLVTNLTGQTGTTTLLYTTGNYGVFTGAVATVTGPAGPGQIQIANGDELAAVYVDAGGTLRTATAQADITPLLLLNVTTTTNIGLLTITWQTTKPANSVVWYGTNRASLNLTVTNAALVTNHVVQLTKLLTGQIYYYAVSSTDSAGNPATNNNSGANFSFTGLAIPTVLLVDAYDTTEEETNGATVIPDSAYTNVLTAAGITYGFWKVNNLGYPRLSDLTPFPVVIWRLTDDQVYYGVDQDGLPDPTATNNTLNAPQQVMIQTYLNNGGSFFLASMGILSQLGDVPFRQNVLQVAGFEQNPDPPAPCPDCDEDFGVPAFVGPLTGIAGGMMMTLDYSSYPGFQDGFGNVYGPDFSDTFTPSATATAITFESVSGKPCGMCQPNPGVASPGRVVFLSFPFDAVPTNGASSDNAVTLLQNAVNFLAPGANGVAVVLLDHTVYTTNALVTVQVGDSDLAGTGQTTVVCSTSSQTNGTRVVLYETAHPGLFSGQVALVAGNAATNQLIVRNGDTLTAAFFDAANNTHVTASATVDTVPPAISQVGAVTDDSDATVSWVTSEPADSSVQYGASLPPDQSAYAGALGLNHAVTLGGLSANRTYYYRVVSRDQAGNSTVDDNHGHLYTFQTFPPPQPPWFDNLESGAPGWTVVPDPVTGSDLNWTLGTPGNGLVTNAYSGTNAWGSDLAGSQNFTNASTYLYSPVIDLSRCAAATLTFRDVGDFSTGFENGQVLVCTTNSLAPGELTLAQDFNGNVAEAWPLETVDLTPFTGQAVQIVFYYEAQAGAATNYGWTIDDIGITGVGTGGTITLTKNLGQGAYNLMTLTPAGPVPLQSGVAPAVTLSNLPAGQYAVQFGDVPFYQTPAGQTNLLTVGGTLNFTGTYTFLDLNNNGISDAWERYYFGSDSTARTNYHAQTECAAFLAGLNPTNPASRFAFTGETRQSNQLVQLQWTVVTNRLYQVNASPDLVNWSPVTAWLQASNSPAMTCTVTNAGDGAQFFRVQVSP